MNRNRPLPTVGQECAVEQYGSWRNTSHFGYIVTHVTPTGQCTVKRNSDGYERKFKADGCEKGGDKYRGDRVRFDCDVIRAQQEYSKLQSAASAAINEVGQVCCKDTYDRGTMMRMVAELEVKVNKAREAVKLLG